MSNVTLVYLAHPYCGDAGNVFKSIQLERSLRQEGVHIFNPVAYFYKFENVIPEPQIMDMCLDMLSRSDALWLAKGWEDSLGCNRERDLALRLGMEIVYL